MRLRRTWIVLVSVLVAGAALGQEAAKQITFSDRHDADPIVSPDGKYMAFSSDRTGNFDIYLLTFGEAGVGIFTSPTAVEGDVLEKYGVETIGRTEDIKERFYAISAERRIKHPAVSAITRAARTTLFG